MAHTSLFPNFRVLYRTWPGLCSLHYIVLYRFRLYVLRYTDLYSTGQLMHILRCFVLYSISVLFALYCPIPLSSLHSTLYWPIQHRTTYTHSALYCPIPHFCTFCIILSIPLSSLRSALYWPIQHRTTYTHSALCWPIPATSLCSTLHYIYMSHLTVSLHSALYWPIYTSV